MNRGFKLVDMKKDEYSLFYTALILNLLKQNFWNLTYL